MHAFLLVGESPQTLKEAKNLALKLKARVFEFPIEKIEDVRQLNSFVSLSVGETTVVVAKDLQKATIEALNAFLKTLEEPQEGLYFILTASQIGPIPPTIVSRCQVISLGNRGSLEKDVVTQAEDFLNAPVGRKLALVSEIKGRQEAKDFVVNLTLGCHSLMLSGKTNPTIYSRAIRAAHFTQGALEANGNVTVQLASLVVSLV